MSSESGAARDTPSEPRSDEPEGAATTSSALAGPQERVADSERPSDRPPPIPNFASSVPPPRGPLSSDIDSDPPFPRRRMPTSGAPLPGDEDGRLSAIEPLLDRGDWAQIAELLGPAEEADKLPPRLALIYAVARKELESTRSRSSRPKSTFDANALAMQSMAALLGVPPDTAIALVMAKRVLRKHYVKPYQRPALPRTSMLVVALAIVFGALVGWLAGPGSIRMPP